MWSVVNIGLPVRALNNKMPKVKNLHISQTQSLLPGWKLKISGPEHLLHSGSDWPLPAVDAYEALHLVIWGGDAGHFLVKGVDHQSVGTKKSRAFFSHSVHASNVSFSLQCYRSERITLNQSPGLTLKIYKSKASDREAKSSWSEVSRSDSWFQVELV